MVAGGCWCLSCESGGGLCGAVTSSAVPVWGWWREGLPLKHPALPTGPAMCVVSLFLFPHERTASSVLVTVPKPGARRDWTNSRPSLRAGAMQG